MRRVVVLGGTGFLGQHVTARLKAAGTYDVLSVGRSAVNLADYTSTNYFLGTEVGKGGAIIHLAYPGSKLGIETSQKTPFDLASQLVQMDLNVIRVAKEIPEVTLVCVGSVCAYPEETPTPTQEKDLWNGYPEPVNAAYGLAKRNQLMLLQAARQQYGLQGIHLILANMYGPGDRSSHVIPALITKVRLALRDGGPVIVWGYPHITRTFLYVEDAAEGIILALERYNHPAPMNLTGTTELTMSRLSEEITRFLGYTGPIRFDASKPTGHRRRVFSAERLNRNVAWLPSTPFADGLRTTIAWHLHHVPLGVPHA